MLNEKKISSIIFFAFLISIITSFLIIKNYDKYEISTDSLENHSMIKGDIPDIWIDGQTIKNDLSEGKNYFESGNEIFRSYLPPRLIAIFSYFFNYELFESWDEKIFSLDNKKIYYLIFQSFFYYLSLLIFFKKIKKYFELKTSFFIIIFLAIEPTVFFFHSSFHTESIFFTMQILMLSLLWDEIYKIKKCILVGILLGFMFLQKLVAIYYIIPIVIYYFFNLKTKAIFPLFIIILFYSLIISTVGYGNFKRAGIFYFMPPSSKITLHLYFPISIISKAEKIQTKEAKQIIENDKKKWLEINDIDLNLEKDRIKYYNYLQEYSIKTLIKYPFTSIKFITWRTLQTGILNPIYIIEFFHYENAKEPPYYQEKEYKKINIPLRITYSLILYSIIIYGFYSSRKNIKIHHHILLIFSSAYMLALLGWANNSRYFVPILIYLSIYFGHGISNLLKLKFFREKIT